MSEKNIFDYATKELSQDAFLRWFFESYDDPDVRNAVFAFLKEFCGLELKIEDIESITTEAQWKRIDVHVMIKTKQRREYDIFIEDKVFSGEHEQLKGYNGDIDEYLKRNANIVAKKLFYKLAKIDTTEKERINIANNDQTIKWQTIDIDQIFDFFNNYASTNSYLLKQYVSHVKSVYEAFKNTKKPNNSNYSNDYLNLICWQAYFRKTIIRQLEEQRNDIMCKAIINEYHYCCLVIHRKGLEYEPYLEIRHRDYKANGEFIARVLCFFEIQEDELKARQAPVIDRIKTDPFWNCNLRSKNGKCPKQIGKTKVLNATDDASFIKLINTCIDHYLSAMEGWK